jgi:hypothetical protein
MTILLLGVAAYLLAAALTYAAITALHAPLLSTCGLVLEHSDEYQIIQYVPGEPLHRDVVHAQRILAICESGEQARAAMDALPVREIPADQIYVGRHITVHP